MKILVTGAAGFIGFHTALRLLNAGHLVLGLDNINSYYAVNLKKARLSVLGVDVNNVQTNKITQSSVYQNFRFVKLGIEDRENLPIIFESEKFDLVINLAAYAGMRHSVAEPFAYIDSNITGFLNILECCQRYNVKRLIYASSSSVYGSNSKVPFAETDHTNNPTNLYAVTKKADELMAACYSSLYNLTAVGLRFFSVYGPWGRADMAPMLFAQAIMNNQPLQVFNSGNMLRDFTYIDDIVDGIVLVVSKISNSDEPRHSIYNLGCSSPVLLSDFILELETALGHKTQKKLLPMQPADVYQTFADTSAFEHDFGYRPKTQLHEGIKKFADWFKAEGYSLILNCKL